MAREAIHVSQTPRPCMLAPGTLGIKIPISCLLFSLVLMKPVLAGDQALPSRWGDWKQLDSILKGWDQTDTGDIIKVKGEYKMWYGAHKNGKGWDGEWKICFATSADGIHWTPRGVVLAFSDQVDNSSNTGCGDASVLYFGGQYHMWFDWKLKGGYDTSSKTDEQKWKIGYATSPDGVKWTIKTDRLKFHPSMKSDYFKATHGLEPRVCYVNDSTLWMFYIRIFNVGGIYRSVSHDGRLTWGAEEQTEEMKTMFRCWDVFWHGGKWHMLYNKAPGPIYIADSEDGLHWTNKCIFLAGNKWSDADTLYPVGVAQDFPCGLCPKNDIRAKDYRLFVKQFPKGAAVDHRMGLARPISVP